MTDRNEILERLIEAARLLGITQAKKVYGVYTIDDGKVEGALHESIDKYKAALAQPKQEPEIVRRVRRYAGKRRESVSSPHINAKECIALANWIESMLAQPEQEPVCDKDPFYCWSIRCQVGKVCKHAAQPEQESISTNDHLCAMLRQVHDVLACTALPMKRKWVGLTDEEIKGILGCGRGGLVDIKKAEQILKEKNGG